MNIAYLRQRARVKPARPQTLPRAGQCLVQPPNSEPRHRSTGCKAHRFPATGAGEFLHVSVGLNASLVFIESDIRVQSGHANVNARLSLLVIRVRTHKPGIEQHVIGQFNNVNVVTLAPSHSSFCPWFRQAVSVGRVALRQPVAALPGTDA